uniref:CCHC-type domain-containing protein n=1 Tax=Caenorhabditis japonica TaxID=281687 RepID=A0A8R1DL19_CAEJA
MSRIEFEGQMRAESMEAEEAVEREVPMSTQDERNSSKIDEDDLLKSDDEEIDEDDAEAFEHEKEVRMNSESKKISAALEYIQKFSRVSPTQSKLMLKSIEEEFQSKEKVISLRENAILAAKNKIFILEKLQSDTAPGDEDHWKLQVEELEREIEEWKKDDVEKERTIQALREQIRSGADGKFQQVCEDFLIKSPEDLHKSLGNLIKLELKLSENKFELLQKLEKEAKLRRMLEEAKQQSETLRLKLKMAEDARIHAEAQMDELKRAAGQNSLSRRGEVINREITHNYTSQTGGKLRISRPAAIQPRSGESFFDIENGVENARAYSKITEEILDSEEDGEVFGNGCGDTQWTSTPKTERIKSSETLLEKILLAQAIPEPKPFSAEKATSLKMFKHSFAMKYRTLPVFDQLILLESRFLEGKALKIFKGIPTKEKTSMDDVFDALAERLRVSTQDEARTAKTRWERLKIREGQTIEDYCLELDEVAKKAFGRTSPEEFSSTKTAKLLTALSDDYQLRGMIEWQLRGIPEEDQYDECRKYAIVLEKGRIEMQQSKKFQHIPAKQTLTHHQAHHLQNVRMNPAKKQILTEKVEEIPKESSPLDKRSSFPPCAECNQWGFHMPTCSKSPAVTCYGCGEKGHIAPKCPKRTDKLKEQTHGNAVNAVDKGKAKKSENSDEAETTILDVTQIQTGKIGSSEVKVLVDSGSTISLISKNIWQRLIRENGKEWEKSIPKKAPEIRTVVAANDTIIKLLFEAKIETIMATRTRKIVYHTVDVPRETIILGTNAFRDMDITMSIGGISRDVKLTKAVRIKANENKMVEVQVEGIVLGEKRSCLITPTSNFLSPAICQVDKDGKTWVQFSNFGNTACIIKKGQRVATGILDGYEVLTDKKDIAEVLEVMFEREILNMASTDESCDAKSDTTTPILVQSLENDDAVREAAKDHELGISWKRRSHRIGDKKGGGKFQGCVSSVRTANLERPISQNV